MAVTIGEIERDLRSLWRDMAEHSQKGEGYALTRACVFNLLIYAPGEGSDREVEQIISKVTTHNPGRIIALLPNTAKDGERISAWVSANCHVSGGKRNQVCCEQVMVRSAESDLEGLSSFVIPLLVPDLPVFLWWRDQLNPEMTLFQELSEVADRIIYDSTKMSIASALSMLQFIQENQQWTAFSDLAWSRLTPWRLAAAQLYDVPAWRPTLESLTAIEVHLPGAAKGDSSLGPALLISWLASRLEWKLLSNTAKNSGQERIVEFEGRRGPITSRILHHSELQDSRLTLKLISGEGNAEFEISQSQQGACLKTLNRTDGSSHRVGITKLADEGEAYLIGKELEILGHDRIFEKALEFMPSFLKE